MSNEQESPFLDPTPPHWVAQGLAYLLILSFGAAVAASIMIRVPETVSIPFALLPMHGADPIRVSRGGIVARVHVTEGQSVRKGEPLFVIQSPPIGDRSSELRTLETQLKGAHESLANARREYESQRSAD